MFTSKILFILIQFFSIFNCFFNYLSYQIISRNNLSKFCNKSDNNVTFEPILEKNCTMDCFNNLNYLCSAIIFNIVNKECEILPSICISLSANDDSRNKNLRIALPFERLNPCFFKRLHDVRKEIKDNFRFRGYLNADFIWPFSTEYRVRYCFKVIGWRTFHEAIGECAAYRLDVFQLNFGDIQDKKDNLKIIDYLWKSFELDYNIFIWLHMNRRGNSKRRNDTVSIFLLCNKKIVRIN